jgi:hypothetical protein
VRRRKRRLQRDAIGHPVSSLRDSRHSEVFKSSPTGIASYETPPSGTRNNRTQVLLFRLDNACGERPARAWRARARRAVSPFELHRDRQLAGGARRAALAQQGAGDGDRLAPRGASMLWRIQMSHWKIQVKCSRAGGSIGKIQIQVALEDPSPGSKSSFMLEGPLIEKPRRIRRVR